MAQIFSCLPSEQSAEILCCYVNSTSRIQIVRIANIPNWYFERVVLPRQRLLFAALPKAQLEIHTSEMASAILADKIDCNCLRSTLTARLYENQHQELTSHTGRNGC